MVIIVPLTTTGIQVNSFLFTSAVNSQGANAKLKTEDQIGCVH
jgi:hypothetical protein